MRDKLPLQKQSRMENEKLRSKKQTMSATIYFLLFRHQFIPEMQSEKDASYHHLAFNGLPDKLYSLISVILHYEWLRIPMDTGSSSRCGQTGICLH